MLTSVHVRSAERGPWYPGCAVAKRSPIAGYNHNVRYRGLIFHVQTEDSGLQSPHLFTHLFHEGVIISTRKLVYDAGSAEEAIKGLMQSQHKLVMKDLKKGTFDEKIELYLGNVEGLLPRGTNDNSTTGIEPLVPRASEPAMQVRMSEPEITVSRPGTDHDVHPEILEEEPPPPPVVSRTATPPPIPGRPQTPTPPRTVTADRRSGPGSARSALPPPPEDLDPPTLNDPTNSVAAAIAAANAANETVKTSAIDSGPEVQIQLELDDSDDINVGRSRPHRDTDIEMLNDPRAQTYSDGVPGQIGGSQTTRTGGDSIQPLPPPPERRTADRGSSAVSASSLPPGRPIHRPPSRQAISPPAVVSRPLTQDDARARGDSDAVEIYGAAPPSAEGPAGERPGQYAQHKRVSQKMPADLIQGRERSGTGSIPIPSGLARPGRASQHPPSGQPGSGGVPQRVPREASPGTMQQTQPLPRPGTGSPGPELGSRPERARTPTPARVSASSPAQSRVPSTSSGGVVMTRPAVIVGAPAKPATPRVRKAREEEGRGFGQGLISEKSLDEVILAYLSEDADDK
ncbi:MAG: hypothetical protein JWP01_1544 [Myxococcales bacterium]|nr:hypothetical protein [Myxococcales bacterium]